MDRNAIIDELTAKGIEFDSEDSDEALQELLDKATPAPTELAKPEPSAATIPAAPAETTPAPTEEQLGEFVVGDPEVLRPRELPLVVKPKSGSWKNDAQIEYAGYLNGYAYSNPSKWAKKRPVLLARLAEIGEDATAIAKYRGNVDPNIRLGVNDTLRQSNSGV